MIPNFLGAEVPGNHLDSSCFLGTGINPGIGNSHLIPDRIHVVLDDLCPLLDTWKEKNWDWDLLRDRELPRDQELPKDQDSRMKLRSHLGLSFQGFPEFPGPGSGSVPCSQLELNFQEFLGKIIESHSLLPRVAELPGIPKIPWIRIQAHSLIPGGAGLPEIPTIPWIRIQPHSLFPRRVGNAEIGSRIPLGSSTLPGWKMCWKIP